MQNERVIPRLVDLRLLAKRVPITEEPSRSRRTVYTLADPHFAFYFRFVAPNRNRIDRGFGEQVVDEIILPRLDTHIGRVFEEIGREYARSLVQAGSLRAVDVGSWWSTDGAHEIDVVGVSAARKPTFAGSVKWRDSELGGDVLAALDRSLEALGVKQPFPCLIIGRHGTAQAIESAGIRSIGLTELYA
jgi:AAA+ ATPase superfamily predicted ATPase